MNEVLPPESPAVSTSVKDSSLNFEAFAKQQEYIKVNENLVRMLTLLLPDQFTHVDVATGTGMVPKLLTAEAKRTGKKGIIIGVDPNTTSLEIARKTTKPSEDVSVEFIEGLGQNLKSLLQGKIPEGGVDGASILDAIHEIPNEEDKKQVLSSMAAILKPGGVLAVNSAFTTYGMEPSPMGWGRWKSKAFKNLGKGQNKNINAIKLHAPDEYRQMLTEAGLTVIHEEKKVVNLSHEALVAISHYPEFINGVFRDMIDQDKFSLKEKRDALVKALDGIDSLPRGWYEIIAQKPSPQTASLA